MEKGNIIKNIYQFAREKNIRISDIEEAGGVSKGYLSRLKDEDGKVPSIDVVVAAAKLFGITVDTLINYSPDTMTEREKYLVKLINKLIKDTASGEIDWVCETKRDIDSIINGDKFWHPLVNYQANPPRFESRFYESSVGYIAGTCYNAVLPYAGDVLYIMSTMEDGESNDNDLELYLFDKDPKNMDNTVEPICSTAFISMELADLIRDLYTEISDNKSNVRLNKDMKSRLDMYIDEIPF